MHTAAPKLLAVIFGASFDMRFQGQCKCQEMPFFINKESSNSLENKRNWISFEIFIAPYIYKSSLIISLSSLCFTFTRKSYRTNLWPIWCWRVISAYNNYYFAEHVQRRRIYVALHSDVNCNCIVYDSICFLSSWYIYHSNYYVHYVPH